MSTVTFDCSHELGDRYYAERPGAAEAAMRERHRLIAELQAKQRERPEENVYGQMRRRQAKAAGLLVTPMALWRKQQRDPSLVLTQRRGVMRLVSMSVLRARARTTSPIGDMSSPPRTARAHGAGRPRAAATRSSVESGDSGDDGPASAPAAAREAVAAAWVEILRRDQPSISWEVRR